ncbi:hypothetical protein llap_16508 [Limosa lapponica baueri]|uniref:Exocyst complex component 3-like protein 4 n=1 Tax=Limosa lapponica baueri TaxID=1758121 RepID=A0A2I0THA2_LIMLA|nr:hypothetical protein llap_16508 [Limosa lapponica baueri]
MEGARAELSHPLGTAHPWATFQQLQARARARQKQQRDPKLPHPHQKVATPQRGSGRVINPTWLEIHLEEWKVKTYLVTNQNVITINLFEKPFVDMELAPRSVTKEPASPTNSARENKMEVASELSSPSLHSRDSGFFERGIKTMLSIRKSQRSSDKEKGKEGTGTWKGKRLSLRFSKSNEENKTTICNGVEEMIAEKLEAEPIQGKPLSGRGTTMHPPGDRLSELFLGHPDLKPEVKTENLSLLLTPADWDKLKSDYITSAKGKIESYFGNILRLEVTEKWEKEVHPEVKENLYHSSLSFDIQTHYLCVFFCRFGEEFVAWSTAQDSPIFAPYFAAYINSFHDLVSGLETVFKVNTEELQKILAGLTRNFTNIFLNKLRTKAQPLLKKILTKDWILATERPDSLASAISEFSKHLQHMREPTGQELLRDVHKYVVREYIVQVIKPRRKMNEETRQQVSEKMNQEARILNNTLIDQGSDSDWLLSAIHHIANIIGEKKKDKIKEYVRELCQDYPDISMKPNVNQTGIELRIRSSSSVNQHHPIDGHGIPTV